MKVTRKLTKKVEGWVEDTGVTNQITLRLRSHPDMLARWRGYCGVETDEEIDYDNPEVLIEWWACDPEIYALADDPDAFIGRTGCDRETYMRLYDPHVEGARFDSAEVRAKAYKQAVKTHRKNLKQGKNVTK